MATGETVQVELNWSYGVTVNGRTEYYGPGLVPVPVDVAIRKGWWKPEEETVIKAETAVSEPGPADVRAQTLRIESVNIDTLPLEAVTELAGVGHLTGPLFAAGFKSAESVHAAAESDLTAVSGIGKATAVKLKAAAEELLA